MRKLFLGLLSLVVTTFTFAGVLIVPDQFSEGSQKQVQQLEQQIMTMKDKDNIIVWSGYGGRTDIGFHLVQTILEAEKSGKTFTIVVHGIAASMHAFSLCYLPSVIFAPTNTVLYHSLQEVYCIGKKCTDPVRTNRNQITASLLNDCILAGYLTEADKEAILLHKKEVIIRYTSDGKQVKSFYEEDPLPNGEGYPN